MQGVHTGAVPLALAISTYQDRRNSASATINPRFGTQFPAPNRIASISAWPPLTELDLNTYIIPVARFPDMDEEEDILDEAGGRSVRLFFGQVDYAQRLVNLQKGDELQTHLNRRCIKQEVEVLSHAPAVETATPAEEPQSVNGRAGTLTFQRVDTVNIYVTVLYGGVADDPSLITVQGQ